ADTGEEILGVEAQLIDEDGREFLDLPLRRVTRVAAAPVVRVRVRAAPPDDVQTVALAQLLAYSGGSRPPIPVQAGHPFRSIPATDSGASRPLIPVIPAGHSGRIRPPRR